MTEEAKTDYTTIRVLRYDRNRLQSFKIHPKQPDSEAFTTVLERLEAQPGGG